MNRFSLIILVLALAMSARAEDGAALARRIAHAKPGTTVTVAAGAFVSAPMPMWGQFVAWGWWTAPDGKQELQVSGFRQAQTMALELGKQTWAPGTRYALPTTNSSTVAAYFTEGRRNFVALTDDTTQQRWLLRIDPDSAGKPVMLFTPVKGKAEFTVQTDANGGGIIDDKDPAEVDERRVIEQACGVDLSNSKVIITEFKLPVHYVTPTRASANLPGSLGYSTT